MNKTDRIVVIGGGTGNFSLLSGLKHYFQNITALVSMVDDGGSTGVLRDELGVLPPGDVRQCLVALSDAPQLRDLFNYRFEDGTFAGHSFGNMFLSAMEKMTGSFPDGVKLASEILQTHGVVLPITTDKTRLVWYDEEGNSVKGESVIGDMDFGESIRPRIELDPKAVITDLAREAILTADLIIISPGDLYASLAAALIVEGVGEAIKQSTAKKLYVCNLVTEPKQTDGFSVADYAAEIERFIGYPALDYVLYNTDQPPEDLLHTYTHSGEFMVAIDQAQLDVAHYQSIGKPLVAMEPVQISLADPIAHTRSLIRHNGDAVAQALLELS